MAAYDESSESLPDNHARQEWVSVVEPFFVYPSGSTRNGGHQKHWGRRPCWHVPPRISCWVLVGIEVVRSSMVSLVDIKSSEVGWIDADVSVDNLSPFISSSTSGMRTYVDLSATMRHDWKLLRLVIT